MNKISIITPVLNGEKYIAETIESILFQRGEFVLEYIVIDGGSDDDTLEICNYYRKLLKEMVDDNRIGYRSMKIYSEPDDGLFDALSKGLGKCTGQIIGYLNSSDRYVPGALSSVNRAFEKNDVKWVTGWNSFSDELGSIYAAIYPFHYDRKLIRQYFYGSNNNHIQQESTFWSKELHTYIDFKKLSEFKSAGDYYLWYQFSKITDLCITNSLLGCFRNHDKQLSIDVSSYTSEVSEIIKEEKQYYFRSLLFSILKYLPNRAKRLVNKYLIKIYK